MTTNKPTHTRRTIGEVADEMNQLLDDAGLEDRWELDTDGESNSVGTWFFGGLGGVTLARDMRSATRSALARAARRCRRG